MYKNVQIKKAIHGIITTTKAFSHYVGIDMIHGIMHKKIYSFGLLVMTGEFSGGS